MKDSVNILISRKKVEWIAYNHKISAHAKMQMVRRASSYANMTTLILNSPLSWKVSADYVAIALDLVAYIIVGLPTDKGTEATIVTYINLIDEPYNVIDKFLVQYQDEIRERSKESNKHDI